jgi:hypothetical protein
VERKLAQHYLRALRDGPASRRCPRVIDTDASDVRVLLGRMNQRSRSRFEHHGPAIEGPQRLGEIAADRAVVIVLRQPAVRDANELSWLVITLPTRSRLGAVACRVVAVVCVAAARVAGARVAGGGMAIDVRGVKVVPDERVQPLSQQGDAAKKGRKSRHKWSFESRSHRHGTADRLSEAHEKLWRSDQGQV